MKRLILTLAATLVASPAFAHLDPEAHGSLAAGLSHPIFGLDHVLAMIAVGLWAASLGGKDAIWFLPSAFVAAMIAGFMAALTGLSLPFVEPTILLSVFALGLAVAFALKLPLHIASGIVALFGLFHGFAHGGELGSAGVLAFGIGFALSTALLHILGVAVAFGTKRILSGEKILKALGWITAAGGFWIIISG
ncbi:HupE/UreJ family protein [Cohaesibacter gelatinilyticus]|uniref:Urease accessory protein n=1 Tax=Cohaesibacter gelatinilyticus TaxID=372072 RepID=A0A285PGC3_9HYPH|nr:HupE/UreJ family protein [Cohaesibacter gelatinilyticus]SNZ19196.1 urease accessory protein [Cohaesibacter gelatinilyticus]